jgi:hypothetical protein
VNGEYPRPLSDEEIRAVGRAFIERLRNSFGTSGCNDLFESEGFPAAVCKEFRDDYTAMDAWEAALKGRGLL